MRICLFTPTFLPKVGGAEINADRILRGLMRRGHDVAVLAQRQRPPGRPDVPYPVSHYTRPPRQHLWPEILAWPLRRAHRRRPFDVMLAFFGYPNGYAASRVKERLGFRLVVCGRGADLYPDFHALRKPRVARCIVEGYRRADRLIMNSAYLRARLLAMCEEQTGSRAIPPLDIVYNGLDLEGLRRDVEAATAAGAPDWAQRAGVRPGGFILQLARLTEVKEHRLVIDAIAAHRARWDEGTWQYVIAGGGSEEDALRRQVAAHGLERSVLFVGPRHDRDRNWLLGQARAMVSPSRDEGLPGALIEAMTVGLPLLASDIAPHREVVHLPDAGRWFRTGDTQDLATQLFRLLDEPRALTAAAARRASERFALETMIDGYERICRELVQGRPACDEAALPARGRTG